MSYVVISYQDKHCSTNQAIRFVSEDPRLALSAAREISSEKEEWDKLFVSDIFICRLDSNKLIYLSDYDHSSNKKPTVYRASVNSNTGTWGEIFFGDFKMYNRRRFGANETIEEKATLGKFRAVIMIDSDEMQQIDVDTETREEAYELCIQAAGDTYPFCVFDDHGIAQTKDGKLITMCEAN